MVLKFFNVIAFFVLITL